jgi:hypothetical protein
MTDEGGSRELGAQAMKELVEVFDDLVTLLKNPEVGAELTARGVNTSLAIVAAEGLAAYVLEGDKKRAADDLSTVAEEIAARSNMKGKAAS